LTPEISADVVRWSTGDSGMCTTVELEQYFSICCGAMGFKPETVWVEVGHICSHCGPQVDTCWNSDTVVIKPKLTGELIFGYDLYSERFWVGLQVHPDVCVRETIFVSYWVYEGSDCRCLDRGIVCDGWVSFPMPESTTVYCADFEYEACKYCFCDTLFVSDSGKYITVIKQPCPSDSSGFIQVNDRRRSGVCSFVFPLTGDTAQVVVNSIEIGSDLSHPYVFQYWETPDHSYLGGDTVLTYGLSRDFDSVIAVYSPEFLCVGVETDRPESPVPSVSVVIEDTLNRYRLGTDTVFTVENATARRFIISNCGSIPVQVEVKWVENSVESYEYSHCPPIKLSNYPHPGFNELSVLGRITHSDSPSSYDLIRNTFADLCDSMPCVLPPEDTLYLYMGVISSGRYHPCYGRGSNIDCKITLQIRWGVSLP